MNNTQLAIILNDLEKVYSSNDLPLDSLKYLRKHAKFINIEDFKSGLSDLGYLYSEDSYDRLNSMYEVMSEKSIQLVQFIDTFPSCIEKLSKSAQNELNIATILSLVIIVILGIAYGINQSNDTQIMQAEDGIVLTRINTELFRDIDKTNAGTLTLISTSEIDPKTRYSKYPDYINMKIKLSIITTNPGEKKLKINYDDSVPIPFELKTVITVGKPGYATAILDLPNTVKSVEWIENDILK